MEEDKKTQQKLIRDVEELKKQIWLLTLKIRNLRESTKQIRKEIASPRQAEAIQVIPMRSKKYNSAGDAVFMDKSRKQP